MLDLVPVPHAYSVQDWGLLAGPQFFSPLGEENSNCSTKYLLRTYAVVGARDGNEEGQIFTLKKLRVWWGKDRNLITGELHRHSGKPSAGIREKEEF